MTATTDLTLYNIENELMFALDTIESLDGPDDAELRKELDTQINALVTAELKKVDGICKVLAHLENQTAFATAEIKRLQARKSRCERQVERLEAATIGAMELAGKKKIEGDTSTLKLQANPASVVILDEALIPVTYKTHIPEAWTVRKDDIKRVLKVGGVVPGADLSEGNMRLVRV